MLWLAHRRSAWRTVQREEGLRSDLTHLAARDIRVRPVVQAGARLARPAAGVTVDHPVQRQPLDEQVERLARRHVAERLAAGRLVIAGRVGVDLGELAARDRQFPAEAGYPGRAVGGRV